MSEGFNRSYRDFAEPARDAGFENDERKLIGMENSLVLEGTSDKFSQSLKPEIITSFFKVLQGDESADPKQILELGNFLYDYRPDQEKPHLLVENEKDQRLLGLGCRMLENAFYDGRLYNLSKERAAALAFTTNVLAKIFEGKDSQSIPGFSLEKLNRFVDEVAEYERRTLFPEADVNSTTKPLDQVLSKFKTEIAAELAAGETMAKTMDWNKVLGDLRKDVDSAMMAISKLGEHYDLRATADLSTWLSDSSELKMLFNRKAIEVRATFERGENFSDSMIYYGSIASALLAAKRHQAEKREGLDDNTNSNLFQTYQEAEADVAHIKVLADKLSSEVRNPARTLKSFDDLASQSAKESVPEAYSKLFRLFEKNMGGGGPLHDYTRHYREAELLLRKRDRIRPSEFFFQNALKRIKEKMGSRATVAYLIKTGLIVGDLLDYSSSDTREHFEWRLSTLREPYDFLKSNRNVHPFLKTGMQHPEHSTVDYGPAYSQLHFIPEELPFSVWASKYLRSKNTKK